MDEIMNYDKDVEIIKTAILQSQYDAARSVNEKQLMLYYGIGKYISLNSRKGFWGKGAIDAISERLDKELPGLRGFTSRNLRYMRTFYEEWEMLDLVGQPENTSENVPNSLELTNSELANTAIVPIWNLQVPDYPDFPMDAFLHIGFTHHRVILGKAKGIEERLFYITRAACRTTSCRRFLRWIRPSVLSTRSRTNTFWTISTWRNWASVTGRM